MAIIDTEFLFALNEEDPKHSKVKLLLQKKTLELKLPITAIYEFIFVLLSKKKAVETIIQSLEVIKDILNEYDIKVLEFNFQQLVAGLQIYNSYKLGLFDCLIMGTAQAFKEILIGDDRHFKVVKEIECKDYDNILKNEN